MHATLSVGDFQDVQRATPCEAALQPHPWTLACGLPLQIEVSVKGALVLLLLGLLKGVISVSPHPKQHPAHRLTGKHAYQQP